MNNTWEKLTELPTRLEQRQEFQKKFKHSVVGIITKTSHFFGYFLKFCNETGGYIFKDIHNNKIILREDTEASVYIPKIERGFYETECGAIFYVTKTGFRQWTRGIYQENTSALYINTRFYSSLGNPLSYSTGVINFLTYNQKTLNQEPLRICDSLLDQLSTKPYMKRLNRNYMIMYSTIHDNGYDLLFHKHVVGHITRHSNTITLKITNPFFKQEILDSISTWGPTLNLDME